MSTDGRRSVPLKKLDYSALIEKRLAPFGIHQAGEDRWRCCCFIHKGDNPTSFSVFRTGHWRCFKCGASGDMAALIMALDHVSLKQAKDYLKDSPEVFTTLSDIGELSAWKDRHKLIKYEVLNESTIAPFRGNCPNYLVDRGFSPDILRRYTIGYDLQSCKIVIPVRDYLGKLVGLTYRVDFEPNDDRTPKYFHDNFEKAKHLYGFHLWAKKPVKRLFLVEGQLDAIRMTQLGHSAVAILGSSMSDAQRDLISSYAYAERIVLAFDNDDAGKGATKSAFNQLSKTRYGRNLECLIYPGKDPGDLRETSRLSYVPWWKVRLLPQQRVRC